jgi:hypothetical protein
MDASVADVPHGNTGGGVTRFDLLKAFGGPQVGRGTDADLLGAELLEEEKLVVSGFGGRLRA